MVKKIIIGGLVLVILGAVYFKYRIKGKIQHSTGEGLPNSTIEDGTIRVDSIDKVNKKLNYSVFLEGGWIPNTKLFTDIKTDNYTILGKKIMVVSDGSKITINTGSFWKDINIDGTVNPK